MYAFDPQLGRRRRYRISLDIPFEELKPGPSGRLIKVVDYDAGSERYYEPVNLEELRAGGGLEPNVGNPKFHQQMVYAVAMKVIANFERALGRRLRSDPLTVLPHAFEGRNAFYHPATNSICLGYYRADPEDPGENIPNQIVFTCLSHDIVAHEVTHALIHRLRPAFNYATNPDVKAFHEGISDIVAIFQHFAYPGVLSEAIEDSGGDLSKPGPLIELARQFGQTTAQGAALRKRVTRRNIPIRPNTQRRSSRITVPRFSSWRCLTCSSRLTPPELRIWFCSGRGPLMAWANSTRPWSHVLPTRLPTPRASARPVHQGFRVPATGRPDLR